VQPLRVVVIGVEQLISLARSPRAKSHPHTQVTLLEASRQPLAKVRISGGVAAMLPTLALTHLLVQHPRGGKDLRKL